MTGPFRLLVVSTPVGPIGSGVGGGVEITLRSLAAGLADRGHTVEVVAPAGSADIGVPVHQTSGAAQPSMQYVERGAVVDPAADAVLTKMWNVTRERCTAFDLVLNLAYDELPFRDTTSLAVPVAHLVSMGSLTDAMDDAIGCVLRESPGAVAMHSHAQAATYADGRLATIIGGGVDVGSCRFVERAHEDGRVAFVGRISAEKGLVDVVRAATLARRPVHVWGYLQNPGELDDVVRTVPDARVTYRGFVEPGQLRSEIGECSALVMAPKWVEAFGNVAVEAMACGVPVVAYRRGGPAEVVDDGRTGFLVPADDIGSLAEAIPRVDGLARQACRERAEREYSVGAFAGRVEAWLGGLLGPRRRADFGGTPLSF